MFFDFLLNRVSFVVVFSSEHCSESLKGPELPPVNPTVLMRNLNKKDDAQSSEESTEFVDINLDGRKMDADEQNFIVEYE